MGSLSKPKKQKTEIDRTCPVCNSYSFSAKDDVIWLSLNVVMIVIYNISMAEKNDGNQAGDQTTNYLLIANYLLQRILNNGNNFRNYQRYLSGTFKYIRRSTRRRSGEPIEIGLRRREGNPLIDHRSWMALALTYLETDCTSNIMLRYHSKKFTQMVSKEKWNQW